MKIILLTLRIAGGAYLITIALAILVIGIADAIRALT